MAGSSKHIYLMAASTLLLAVVASVGIWIYLNGADTLTVWFTDPQSASPSRTKAPSSTPVNPPSVPAKPENPQAKALPLQNPSRELPFANGARSTVAPGSPAFSEPPILPEDISGHDEADEAYGKQRAETSQIKQQNRPDNETTSAFTLGQTTEELPRQTEKPSDATGAMPTPLIIYGKGTTENFKGNMVQGEIPRHQVPPNTTELYGSPESSSQSPQLRRISPKGEDSVVSLAFIQELAKFLADNYWPAGTHPRARRRGITTASVKWADVKFGAYLQGFNVTQNNIPQERVRVLHYAFMPSMIKGLYALYNERFLNALEQEALSQNRGSGKRPLNDTEITEMFTLYGSMARGLAKTVRAYAETPGIRRLVQAYVDTAQQAEQANHSFLTALHDDTPKKNLLAKQHQATIQYREQQREKLISALGRNGVPQGLDNDTVMYTVLWLYRRGESTSNSAAKALADVLDTCADSLEAKRRRNVLGKNTPQGSTQ